MYFTSSQGLQKNSSSPCSSKRSQLEPKKKNNKKLKQFFIFQFGLISTGLAVLLFRLQKINFFTGLTLSFRVEKGSNLCSLIFHAHYFGPSSPLD